MVKKPTYEELEQMVRELKRGNAKSQVNGKRFRDFVDYLGDAVYEIDLYGNITYLNEMAGKIAGRSIEELIGEKFLSLFTKENQEIAIAEYQKALNGESPTYGLTLTNGVTSQFKNQPRRNKDGNITGIFAKAIDIPAQKPTEEALREIEYRYNTLIEGPLFAMIIHDMAPYFVTKKAAELFGYNSPEDLTHSIKYIEELFKEEYRVNMKERRARRYETKETSIVELVGLRKDGTEIPLLVGINVTDWKGEPAIQCTYYDITDLKQAEEALRKAHDELEQRVEERTAELIKANEQLNQEIEERKRTAEALKNTERKYRELFEEAPVMYVITRNDKGVPIIENCNELFLRSLGYRRDQVLERHLADFYTSESKAKLSEGHARALAGRFAEEERQLVTSDGRVVETLLRALPQIDSEGKVVGTRSMYLDISERIIVQKELAESEKRYRSLVEMSPGAILVHIEGKIVYVNPEGAKVYGAASPAELTGRSVFDIFHPDYYEIVKSRIEQIYKDRKQIPWTEMKYIRLDGRVIEVESTGTYITYSDKPAILSVVRDITEQKETERKLGESEVMFHELFNEAPVGYHEIDSEGRITRVNRTELDMLGFKAEEMLGRPIWDFVVEEEEEVSRENFTAKMSGAIPPDKVFERTRKRKDGTTFSSLATSRLLKDEQGHATGIRTTIQDISDKKRIEDQLLKSKVMLQAVFDGISEPLIMVGTDMRVLKLNRPATQLYNIEYHEAVGNFCFKAFKARSEPCEDCRIPSAVSIGKQVIYERKGYKDPDRIEKVVIYPVREKERKTGAAIIRISDITAEKKMERELIQADKMISLGILVSGVAHEINNPNNFIMLNTPLLREAWETVVPILEKYYEENGDFSMAGLSYSEMRGEVPILFKGIEDGSSRIKHIVEDLKDYSRQDISEMDQTVDVNRAIKTAVSLVSNLIKRSTRKFRLNCQNNLPPIQGNLQKLEQVVINLIQNACHALSGTEEGVFVTASFDEKKDGIVIEVRDEGRGIPDELLARIMDPFFTTKRDQGGTGLGLSVSLRIVKEHGGTIDVKSERGKGSTFKIFLPVKRKEKLVKILVADDEDTIREFLTTVLRENQGYSVREASTGTEACVKLGSDRPDLLILDVIMPDMNGVEVCRLIRKEPELSGIRIIVITGFPDSPEVKEIADMGFNNILSKPFKASDLMETVAAVLEDGR